MKNIPLYFFLLLFINSSLFAQNSFGEFAELEFNVKSKNDAEDLNFFAYLFETKKQFIDFLNIQKGDIVTEIGAGNGINIGVMSMLLDSVTFIAQDIDAKMLNDKNYKKIINEYQKHRTKPQTNKFELVIGNVNSSNLTDNTFDELFVINSFHDFDKQDEMLADIYKKLKPNGRFILLEGSSFPKDTQICQDYGPHVLHTLDVDLAKFEKHGFYLTKMRAPYFKAAHYGNGLILVKDKKQSDAFYKEKNEIDEVVSHAFRFKQNDIAKDSMIVKQITDSILTKLNTITSVYPVFEVWIKDLGFKHIQKSEYLAAIHIFKSNTRFFPNSYQAFYWLGVAYEKNKLYDLALANYNMSITLQPTNKICLDKIKAVTKLKNTSH
jgi:ubiquinone/menaquinone biosynthesis C-methylase UbiE